MQKFKVDIERELTHDYHSNEEFGDWEESYSNTFNRITLDNSIEYPDLTSSLKFSVGDIVYVVWVEYSYGDSFGSANRAGSEAVAVFKDGTSAYDLKRAIETQRTDGTDWNTKYQLKLQTSDGQKFDIYTGSWHDYFGGLDSVHVEETLLDG